MITEQSIIDELKAKPEVKTVHVNDGAKLDGVYRMREIKYSTTGNDVGKFTSFHIVILNPDTPGEETVFHERVPDILREAPVTPEQREFIMTPQAAIAEIEAHYLAKTTDEVWDGEVFEDSLQRYRKNSRDEIRADVRDGKVIQENKRFMVSELTDIEAWSQPAGAHDAIPLGEKRSHNGKIWENTFDDGAGGGNAWEPGTTNSQWVEVAAVRFMVTE